MPSRRSTVATMVRASARSRSGSAPSPLGFEQVVERTPLPQHAADDVGGDAPRRKAGEAVAASEFGAGDLRAGDMAPVMPRFRRA